jgi:hypothetical protein
MADERIPMNEFWRIIHGLIFVMVILGLTSAILIIPHADKKQPLEVTSINGIPLCSTSDYRIDLLMLRVDIGGVLWDDYQTTLSTIVESSQKPHVVKRVHHLVDAFFRQYPGHYECVSDSGDLLSFVEAQLRADILTLFEPLVGDVYEQ